MTVTSEALRWSVVIPYFNERDYLPATLASLYTQDMRAFRLILVDNASTDGSGALAREIAGANSALEALQLAQADGVDLAAPVAARAWDTATQTLKAPGVELEILVFDRAGGLLARAPFRGVDA